MENAAGCAGAVPDRQLHREPRRFRPEGNEVQARCDRGIQHRSGSRETHGDARRVRALEVLK